MNKTRKHQIVDRLYREQLKKIEKITGDKTTYLKQVESTGKQLWGVKFKGVYPSDKIPKLNDLSPYCILNLDSSEEPGSHWVVLAKNIGRSSSIFYDSFGRDHARIIPNLRYSGNGRIINTDDDPEQKINQENCGARCLSFLCILDKYGPETARLI